MERHQSVVHLKACSVEFCSVSTALSVSVDFSQCPSFFPGAALQL